NTRSSGVSSAGGGRSKQSSRQNESSPELRLSALGTLGSGPGRNPSGLPHLWLSSIHLPFQQVTVLSLLSAAWVLVMRPFRRSVFADVQTSTARENILHHHLLPLRGGHRNVKQSAPRALAVARLQFGVRNDVQVRLVSGLHAPRTVGLLPA